MKKLNHHFCRTWLNEILPSIKTTLSKEEVKKAWVWSDGRHFEFHGPNKFLHRCSSQVDCRWSAAAEGWLKWVEKGEK